MGDIAFLNVADKVNIVTLDAAGQIAIFSPEENKVIESLAPEGVPTCVRVFPQFADTLFVGYSKQAPGGAKIGSLLVLSGANKIEVEAHENDITDLICMSVNDPQFTGEVFFTSSTDCKYKILTRI